MARGGRADHRRLLRDDAGAHRRRGAALAGTKPGRRRAARGAFRPRPTGRRRRRRRSRGCDERGRSLFPLPFPEITVEEGVFVPTQGSYLLWKHLFRTGIGEGATCLDVGCGCGILSVQLALNGATRVHAIDIDRNAVANTLSNAFRNGVADRITGEDVDLYHWDPTEQFDLIVGEPLPDAGRSLRGADRPPAARLLGPQPPRSLPGAAPRACWRPGDARS